MPDQYPSISLRQYRRSDVYGKSMRIPLEWGSMEEPTTTMLYSLGQGNMINPVRRTLHSSTINTHTFINTIQSQISSSLSDGTSISSGHSKEMN